MNPFFWRTVAVLVLVILGSSFLPIVFGSSTVSLATLFSLSVVATLSYGFSRALPVAILSGLLADCATLGPLGLSAAFCVGLVYVASFSSRRMVTDHGFLPFIVSGIVVGLSITVFRFFSFLVSGAGFPHSFASFSFGSVGTSLLSGIIVFPVVFVAFRRFEVWASAFDTQSIN
ncbi:MAG: hypothetical protein WCL23_02440 [Candidatus Moraniibacteriota bacterium]